MFAVIHSCGVSDHLPHQEEDTTAIKLQETATILSYVYTVHHYVIICCNIEKFTPLST